MRARWKRGRGPSKGWRALEALAKACAGLALLVVLTHALTGAGIDPTEPSQVLATVILVVCVGIGVKASRTARRIERDTDGRRTGRTGEPASETIGTALPDPGAPEALPRPADTPHGAGGRPPTDGGRIARRLKSLFHVE